ncbi:MAG: KH domain-containing protein [Spirochaetaceae bacterium]|nr:KH domain-containing protein [Spirochaetaceae bacterium]
MEKDLIEYIVKSLVDDPSAVSVRIVGGDESPVFELKVGPEDVGKAIGKHGRVVKAVRTLLQATAAKAGRRAMLEILE